MPRCKFAVATAALLVLSHAIAPVRAQALQPDAPVARSVPALTVAVAKRDLTRLRQLLDAGEDPNQRDDQLPVEVGRQLRGKQRARPAPREGLCDSGDRCCYERADAARVCHEHGEHGDENADAFWSIYQFSTA